MTNLRQRQQDILEFIAGFIDGHGYPPSCLLYTSPSPRD